MRNPPASGSGASPQPQISLLTHLAGRGEVGTFSSHAVEETLQKPRAPARLPRGTLQQKALPLPQEGSRLRVGRPEAPLGTGTRKGWDREPGPGQVAGKWRFGQLPVCTTEPGNLTSPLPTARSSDKPRFYFQQHPNTHQQNLTEEPRSPPAHTGFQQLRPRTQAHTRSAKGSELLHTFPPPCRRIPTASAQLLQPTATV